MEGLLVGGMVEPSFGVRMHREQCLAIECAWRRNGPDLTPPNTDEQVLIQAPVFIRSVRSASGKRTTRSHADA